MNCSISHWHRVLLKREFFFEFNFNFFPSPTHSQVSIILSCFCFTGKTNRIHQVCINLELVVSMWNQFLSQIAQLWWIYHTFLCYTTKKIPWKHFKLCFSRSDMWWLAMRILLSSFSGKLKKIIWHEICSAKTKVEY